MSSIDEVIERLNKIPADAMSLLRQIRNLDKEVEEIQSRMEVQKAEFFRFLTLWQGRRNQRDKDRADDLYVQIQKKDRKVQEIAKQKVKLAQNLYNLVHEPTEKLGKEVDSRRSRDRSVVLNQNQNGKKKKSRRNRQLQMKQKWDVDPSEPVYCYCAKPSFGSMINCQNSDCDKEWFHIQCLEEKVNLSQKWYCKQCRKSTGSIREKLGSRKAINVRK